MAMLVRGVRGLPVQMLQEKLGLEADGIFGSGTQKAVKAAQQEHGLSADGVAGPDTFAALELYELVLLKKGMKGATVKKLQAALGLDDDGIFGSGTERAVRAFQEQNGLSADGLVGPDTIGALDLFGVKAAAEAQAEAEQAAAEAAVESKNVWAEMSVEDATEDAIEQVKSFNPFLS